MESNVEKQATVSLKKSLKNPGFKVWKTLNDSDFKLEDNSEKLYEYLSIQYEKY